MKMRRLGENTKMRRTGSKSKDRLHCGLRPAQRLMGDYPLARISWRIPILQLSKWQNCRDFDTEDSQPTSKASRLATEVVSGRNPV